jgi:hypothetical protein
MYAFIVRTMRSTLLSSIVSFCMILLSQPCIVLSFQVWFIPVRMLSLLYGCVRIAVIHLLHNVFSPLKLTSTFTMIPSTDAEEILIYCYEYLCGLDFFEKSGKVPTLLFAFLELCLPMYR